MALEKLVQTLVLYCAHSPLYQSGIAGRSSRMYFWICEWIFFAFATFDVGTLFSASVNAHGFGPAAVNRAKLANVC